ncbi:heparinase II/III family protein [Rheinheimera soli]|uniref:Heparin-sulfate lyase N-terminal domain-containing protein n=1 Tax=Rheinheimera soli TaxID=443616 RepID=A0ABU1VUB0_9GAMM|nr:heparinase II/III family protein [Rheinheimera soli]MDR7119308.1 hypothetical protein [Rheinheimera soli]
MKVKPGSAPELIRCVQKKLKQAFSDAANQNLGQALFVSKKLKLAPFAAVDFTGWDCWEQDPLNNRSWQWRLNWLSFLPYLMAYHRASGNDEVLHFAREAIQSWLNAYLKTDTSYPFEFIWHDHATALRAEQFVLFSYYCREHAPVWAEHHMEFFCALEQAIVVHGLWLAKDSFYSQHTNHGLEQARVLLLLGVVFDGELANEWQNIAITRIISELEYSFTDEGVHVENSPAYHIFVFKVFLGIIKDYSADILGDLDQKFSFFSAKALNFITYILRPDGKLPPIGDTEQLPTSDAYRDMFGHTLEYQYFLYALTQGKHGVPPPALNHVFAKSGYAVFRDQWPASEHYDKAFHLIAKVGCSSRYHHQQDEGHVSLYAGGEDWLIDSGLYNYISNDPVRKYMRGRVGHNVPIISHANYSKDFEHRMTVWQVTDFSEHVCKPFLNMQLNVLVPLIYHRRVDFDAVTKVIEVKDKVTAEDQQLRNITLQWHFPKDKTIVIEENGILVSSSSGSRLRISFVGEVPDQISMMTGSKDDKVFSCISYKANKVEPSHLVRVLFKERAELEVSTRFSFDIVETKLAPVPASVKRVVQPFSSLITSHYKSNQCLNTAMLGNDLGCIELAKAHRASGIGHVSVLAELSSGGCQLKAKLSENYLTTWLNCRTLNISSIPPIVADMDVLHGLEGLDLLVITGAGFSEIRLTTILLTMLPVLFKRMTKSGEVWICDSLPERLKVLCEIWCGKYGLPLSFISDLEQTTETSDE